METYLARRIRRRSPAVLWLVWGGCFAVAAVVGVAALASGRLGVVVAAPDVFRAAVAPVAVKQPDPDKAAVEHWVAKMHEPDALGGIVRWHKCWVHSGGSLLAFRPTVDNPQWIHNGSRVLSFRVKVRNEFGVWSYVDYLACVDNGNLAWCRLHSAVLDD